MDVTGPISSIAEEFELLERHISILKTVCSSQPIGLIRLSECTGIPKHKVRYSLKLLEQQGIIRATPEGAVTTDRYAEFMASIKNGVDSLLEKAEKLRNMV